MTTSQQFDESKHPRGDGDGKFTEKVAVDPGVGVLPQPVTVSALKDVMLDRFQRALGYLTIGDLEAAIEVHPNDLDAAAQWLHHQGLKHVAVGEANEGFVRLRTVRRSLVKSSLTACAHRILQEFPDATTVEMYNTGEGDVAFDIDDDSGDLQDDLRELVWMDLRSPGDLIPYCTGYDETTKLAEGFKVTTDDRGVEFDSATLDLAKLTA